MSICYNILDQSDVITTPIKLKYTSSMASSSLSSKGITIQIANNGPVSITGSVASSTLLFRTVKQLYYQTYLTGSVLFSSSLWNCSEQSTAAYGSGDEDYRYFPTASNEKVTVVAIPRTSFGENIARKSLRITSSLFQLEDDGNGNIVDCGCTGDPRVGNILYSQGIIVITDTAYVNQVTSSATWKWTAESTIYQNEVRCHVNENDFNYTLNPSAIVSGSNGIYLDAITGSDFRPYATTVGLYNDQNELLVVGKLSTPYPIPSNTDITFAIRWDS